ncbi:hypothetical protein J4E91_010853 [Alternaria rosae]|nr:hypothetical protein J4E91_010853 [Alternaria rosae]
MKNTFSSLSVGPHNAAEEADTEDEPAPRPDDSMETLPPVNRVEIQQDESEIESGFFFAIQSFMTNIHELRDIVQVVRFSYKDGKVDLVNASVIANTAIDLIEPFDIKEQWGCIAKDDKAFASPLRKAHEAIQNVIFEVQPEPKTALGIFSVDPKTIGCATHGGDVCLGRLAKESKDFATSIVGGQDYFDLLDLYKNWHPEKAINSHVLTCCTNKARGIQEEEDKNLVDSMRFYNPDIDAYYHIVDGQLVMESSAEDYDPCADCPRCIRIVRVPITMMGR